MTGGNRGLSTGNFDFPLWESIRKTKLLIKSREIVTGNDDDRRSLSAGILLAVEFCKL